MFCPFCGSQLTEGAAFCPNCGNKLAAAGPAQQTAASQSAGSFTVPEIRFPNAAQAPAAGSPPAAPVWNDPYQSAGLTSAASSQPAQVWNNPYQSAEQTPAASSQPAQVWNNPYQNGGQAAGSYSAPSSGSYTAPASGTYSPPASGTYRPTPAQGTPVGQGQYSAPQAPGYQPYQPQPAAAQNKPKKKSWLLIAGAALIFLAVLGFLGSKFLGGSDGRKLKTLLQEGSEARQAGDYDLAISKYEAAAQLDKENQEAQEGLFYSYKGKSDQLADKGDYENAIRYAKRMATTSTGKTDANKARVEEALDELYQKWLSDLVAKGDKEKAKSVLADAKPYLTETEFDDWTLTVELSGGGSNPTDDPITVVDQQSFADRIAQLADAGDLDSASQLVYDYQDLALQDISSGNRKSFRVAGRDFDGVQIVDDGSFYYVYYGDFDASGSTRDGVGWVITYAYTSDDSIEYYYYITEWENGKANGDFYEYVISGEHFENMERYEGTLKDGLYEGRITYINEYGDTYYADFVNGILQVQGYTDEGYRITWQGEESGDYYYVTHNDDFQPLGVACF